jgi:hypothetical protein
MGFETDKRFNPRRFKGAPAPRRYSAEGRSDKAAEATRKACFEESALRNQYQHPVVVGTEPTGRNENK